MKTSLVLSLALCCATTNALAVKLNPEAMRAMQQAGDRIVAEAMKPRTFRLSTGLCLTMTGGNRVIAATCQPNQPAQVWRLDDKGHLLHNGSGMCLAAAVNGIVVQPCGNAPSFKWTTRANGQVVNGGNGCLHAVGNINASNANLVVAGCQVVPSQVWK